MLNLHCPWKQILSLTAILCVSTSSYLSTSCSASQPPLAQAQAIAAPIHLPAPEPTSHYTRSHPAPVSPFLRWQEMPQAVAWEIELSHNHSVFHTTKKIYINGYNVKLPDNYHSDHFQWRVRALDIDAKPISPYSAPQTVYISHALHTPLSPEPTSVFNNGNGTVLLYPVYNWIPVNGVSKYEVEILNAPPENPHGIAPSIHRIDTQEGHNFDCYDRKPRLSTKPMYWRVRGLDEQGQPVGVYSPAREFTVNPAAEWQIATYGDSISHGGGNISYSPSQFEYSYQSYLNFPVINLSESGDTSASLLERFERDVLPFHPAYLIIMGGTNSLRAATSATDVIADLTELRDKCLAHNIKPIFLTLPPLNPANIYRAFQQTTAEDWQEKFAEVNDFIRTQTHIDIAADIPTEDGLLPTYYGRDGLHLDVPGKKLMAQAINRDWDKVN